jgi:sugar-specific transcriptional regulator TrmB
MKTLELKRNELDKLLSEIKKFSLEINEYEIDRNIEEMIGNTDDEICLFLDINVHANVKEFDYDNETGYDSKILKKGYFELLDVKPYCEDIGDVHLVDWQMKIIRAEIDKMKIFE